ncbi:hypothetical protein, partial [Sulfuracidifex metallicus]
METQTVEKDLQTIRSLLKGWIFLNDLISSKLLVLKDMEILILENFERDVMVHSSYISRGYARVGRKILPVKMYYSSLDRDLTIYVGHVSISLSIQE